VPKQSPIPNEVDKPFYDAANDERLVIQFCGACQRWQFPPQPGCAQCGSAGSSMAWREVAGRGTIYSYGVVYDSPITSLQADQPYNVAVISLDQAPEINMLSHLPGSKPGEVEIGRGVRLVFEVTPATGQKVPEWQVI
jgi:uncharacterized OB-fold protein